jgi:microsomal dipeptidase-like Zn-dependent dipeptidase
VAFDPELRNWPDRQQVFADRKPIAENAVRAVDVDPHWSPAQQKLLSRAEQAKVDTVAPLGGDYWSEAPYPIAPRSAMPWISSAFEPVAGRPAHKTASSEALVGSMTSKPFELTGHYLRMALGGAPDRDVFVELWVQPQKGHALSSCAPSLMDREGFVRVRVVHAPQPQEGDGGDELLKWVELKLSTPGCGLEGLQARVRIVDDSRGAHINVAGIALNDELLTKAPPEPTPVWGFADYHVHPTDNLGFGGLQGIHLVWGAPGGAMSEYVEPEAARRNLTRDIPSCDEDLPFSAHQGGFTAPVVINAAEGRVNASVDDLPFAKMAYQHPSKGGPTFADFPDFRRGAHEQHHITQIHRAYLGGLRLMSALAVHNPAGEYGAGWVRCSDGKHATLGGKDLKQDKPTRPGSPTVDVTDDWAVIRAHVRAMRQLAQLNHDWMEIAYSPADARNIIRANKLAVVLGVEVPRLGDDEVSVEEQVRELEDLGVRQVVPIHALDNRLGGAAIINDLYNGGTDLVNRPDRDWVETLSGILDWTQRPRQSFFDVTTDASPTIDAGPDGEAAEPTERVALRLNNPPRGVLSDVFPMPGRLTYQIPILGYPFGDLHTLVAVNPLFVNEEGPYDGLVGGQRNTRRLTGRGAEFIEHLMKRGMLVDLAHMSDATLADVYGVVGNKCNAYPLMISHTHFRPLALKVDYSDRASDFEREVMDYMKEDVAAGAPAMSACIRDNALCDQRILEEAQRTAHRAPLLGPGTVNRQNLAREFDVASSELQQVRGRQGVVGVFLGQGAIDSKAFARDTLPGKLAELGKLPFNNDCAASSKGLAAALLYGSARMGEEAGVGVASDFTLVGNPVPRFGDDACAGYLGGGSGLSSSGQLLETILDADQYQFDAQRDGVVYSRFTTPRAVGRVTYGKNAALEPYKMGDRTYDYNVDGLAHIGMEPDMLQDVANVLGDSKNLALDPVFRSAEGYLRMWERARALAGCEGDSCRPVPKPEPVDPECTGEQPLDAQGLPRRLECGSACPCGWNRGAPLQEIDHKDAVCDPYKPVTLLRLDAKGKPAPVRPVYQQRRADPMLAGDLTQQGDWAVFPIHPHQEWACGSDGPQFLDCPDGATFVKVRRTLDTTVSRISERCDFQPLPPQDGNRRVIFQCLVGGPSPNASVAGGRSP